MSCSRLYTCNDVTGYVVGPPLAGTHSVCMDVSMFVFMSICLYVCMQVCPYVVHTYILVEMDVEKTAFLCLPGPNENPFSVSKHIEESFFNAMEAGHHTLMDFFPM